MKTNDGRSAVIDTTWWKPVPEPWGVKRKKPRLHPRLVWALGLVACVFGVGRLLKRYLCHSPRTG